MLEYCVSAILDAVIFDLLAALLLFYGLRRDVDSPPTRFVTLPATRMMGTIAMGAAAA